MNDESVYNRNVSLPPLSQETTETQTECASELLGAVDIVEAFTALRHELKLQVRGGRELQQSLSERLQRIEERLAAQRAPQSSFSAPDDSRELAVAVAEIEESLHRAVDTFARQTPAASARSNVLDRFDQAVLSASWAVRKFGRKLLSELRSIVEQTAGDSQAHRELLDLTHRGLELLLARVHRLMQQSEIERIDVLRKAFDAETMHAVDVTDAPSVPSNHVAEQLRPAYLWRGKILRYADVRLAK